LAVGVRSGLRFERRRASTLRPCSTHRVGAEAMIDNVSPATKMRTKTGAGTGPRNS